MAMFTAFVWHWTRWSSFTSAMFSVHWWIWWCYC